MSKKDAYYEWAMTVDERIKELFNKVTTMELKIDKILKLIEKQNNRPIYPSF